MRKYVLFFAVFVMVVRAAAEQSRHVSDAPFVAVDQQYARPLAAAGLGFAVKVFTKDKIIHQASFGMANLKTGELNTEKTNFNLASNTKQFTAGLALLLEQEGKLNTTDLVSKYIVEFPAQGANITVDQLIHHTSGLPEYWELCDGKSQVKNRDILNLLAKKQLEFTPGSRFSYSNSGYVVLSEIVERLAGRTFSEFLNERIFKPLGMITSVERDERSENHIAHRAIGYDGAPGFKEDDESVCNYNHGDSNIYSNLDDYSKWLLALSTGQLFTATSRDKIFAKSKTGGGQAVGYGYGWGIYQDPDGTPYYEHSGSWQGFRTIATFLPSQGIWVVALSNCSDFKEAEVVDPYIKAALFSSLDSR
jgi:CubicO group peptidase (beta-lactamase class C family)